MTAIDPLTNLNSYEIGKKLQQGELIVCERRGRSKVWEVFAKIQDLEGVEIADHVYCRNCGKVFKYNKVSTSNLVKHKCYYAYKGDKIPKSPNELNETTESLNLEDDADSPVQNRLSKLIMKCLIKDCIPYSFIRSDGLKDIFKELVSCGSKFGNDVDVDTLLPSLTKITRNINDIYEQYFESVKEELATIKDNGFGLSSDIWCDNSLKRSYIVLNIHFLRNGVLLQRLLGLRAIEGDICTSETIYEKIETILKDFDLQVSPKTIITTSGKSDISKAFKNNQKLTCISQLLSKALQQSMKEIPEVADLIRACSKLMNFLKQTGYTDKLNDLKPKNNTNNWIALYNMLTTIETNWPEIAITLHNINEIQYIKDININDLKAVTKHLQTFEEALETLEDDNNATLHLVLVYLHELKKSCDINDNEFKDLDIIESLKEKLRYHLDLIVQNNVTILHKLALFLYPPTNKLLQFNNEEKKSIEQECIRLMNVFKGDIKPVVKQEPQSNVTASPVSKRKKLFSDFVEPETIQDPNELIIQELKCYKNTRVVNRADFDVFNWWQMQKDNFPLLYKLSCIVLATPASSATVQRIFSNAAALLYDKLSSRDSNGVEMEHIMFINCNSQSNELEFESDF